MDKSCLAWLKCYMHLLVGLHDTMGSIRPRRDFKAVQYSLMLMVVYGAFSPGGTGCGLPPVHAYVH
jgi:hypothetical protein